jgi:hypothetical protein
MNETIARLQAALTEQKAITDTVMQRCVNLAGEVCVLRERNAALVEAAKVAAEEKLPA